MNGPSGGDTLAVVTALAAALTAILIAGLAAAGLFEPSRPTGMALPACSEWSDGCVVCARQPGGAVACSMPGIACTRGSVQCLRP
ncbi:MAG TPA: hypothetical protein VGU45_02685 [Microvirga sp.]|nr:hypothetical protein [Microvirga sp.]